MGERLQPKDVGLRRDTTGEYYKHKRRGTKLVGDKKKKKGLKKGKIFKAKDTKPGAMDDDAIEREKKRKAKMKEILGKL